MPVLNGTPGNDLLAGSDENDGLYGFGGNDILAGGRGVDILEGGDGDDVISIAAPVVDNIAVSGRIDGGAGYDILDLSGVLDILFSGGDRADGLGTIWSGRVGLNRQAFYMLGIEEIRGGAGADYFSLLGLNGGTLINVTVRGGAGADQITGGYGADILYGDDGNDILSGDDQRRTRTTDTIFGGSGDDIIYGGLEERISGGADNDLVILYGEYTLAGNTGVFDGGAGVDLLWFYNFQGGSIDLIAGTATLGGQSAVVTGFENVQATIISGSLTVQGTEGDNQIVVTSGGGVLSGRGGDDTLVGGYRGSDALFGGEGNDILQGRPEPSIFDGSLSATPIDDLDGGQGTDQAVFFGARSAYTITTSNGVTTVLRAGEVVRMVNVEYLRFSDGLVGIDGRIVTDIVGTAAAETLYGSPLSDTISGLNGGDTIYTGGGSDVIRYALASDSSRGFGEQDTIVDFQTALDVIDLSALNPSVVTIARNNFRPAYYHQSLVYIETPTGGMTLIINALIQGSDILTGNATGIYMTGTDWADALTGSARKDSLHGGLGSDIITGGGEADALFGGADADTFVYRAASDSTLASADIIFDFISGQDVLDLSAIRTGISDTFGIAYLNGGSFLFVDLAGNGSNDMLIQLTNVRLAASDILWTRTSLGEEPVVKSAGPEVLPVPSDADAAWGRLVSNHDDGMHLLAEEGLVSARGHDWYL